MSDDIEIEETAEVELPGQSGENESLLLVIDELQKSPSQFALTVVNEIKALQSRYVLIRLDRDNWRKDYETERNLADRLFDVLSATPNGSAEEFEHAKTKQTLIHEYRLRRGGYM